MNVPRIIIAIDGYSSTGKSSFAKLIAEELGFIHLDSGALYRAVTLYALRHDMIDYRNRVDENALLEALMSLSITLKHTKKGTETYLEGENVDVPIRQMDVSNAVSPVSAIPFVRNFVDKLLNKYAKEGGVVMDGRDIGTNVFPSAQLKIFMTADTRVRAERRFAEMKNSGKKLSVEEVMKNLEERDYIDSHRAVSPLKKADDAIVLDNTDMTLSQQMEWLRKILEERWG